MSPHRLVAAICAALLLAAASASVVCANVKPKYADRYAAALLTLDAAEQGLLNAANAASDDVADRGRECLRLVASTEQGDKENLESLKQMAATQATFMAKQIPILRKNTLKQADRVERDAENWFADEPGDHIRLNRGLGDWRRSAELGLQIFALMRQANVKLSDADCEGARTLARQASAKARTANEKSRKAHEILEGLQ
jgi:hypothetical protein